MKIVCAWCGEDKGEKDGPHDVVTHTICGACLEFMKITEDGNFLKYITITPNPIVMLDKTGKVTGANAAAVKYLGKPLSTISGIPCGNAFGCIYSRLPEGCGNTMHCYACAVRKAVMKTHETGEPVVNAKVMLNVAKNAGAEQVHFTVSTYLSRGIVYLRIEEQEG